MRTLLRGQRPKDLKRGKPNLIISSAILPGVEEANEAEAPTWTRADLEVAGHTCSVQVTVVIAAVHDLPLLSVV